MGARKDKEQDFIPGIYDYCDRWCERCPLTHRCLLFYREEMRRARHKERGEDADAWNVRAQDMAEDLKEAKELVTQAAEEHGIDLAVMMGPPGEEFERPDISRHPLRVKAHKFAMDSHRFLDQLCNFIHEEERRGVSCDDLAGLQDCFEILSWYHMQIAVKIDRALNGKMSKRTSDLSVFSRKDADGSAKVAYMGLLKSLDALTRVYEGNQSMHREIMPLLTIAFELAEEVTQVFPGQKNFKRPGFDD